MYVKHIILEGFKSYKDRTDIGPFDPHFNAITGLNGSGKSNILDAICFVLGLSSLQVVRAANLAELIYKGSTGAAARASASIVFDNRNKTPGKCPVGYEKFDEIIVSRTVEPSGSCKYYLNSMTSTKKQITDLFESIQLNISNPNFMIMQGKITKVINMTPKQILSMIEETVGGNVYQGKRDKTEQEIKNKERCIDTVKGVIHEDIYPEWKRQRDARDRLTEFQTIDAQTSRAIKYYAIMKFQDIGEKLQRSQEELNKVLSKEAQDDEIVENHKKAIEENKQHQQQMKQDNQEKFKGQIESAEKSFNTEKKAFVTMEAKINSAKMDVEDAKKKLVETEKAKKQQEKEMTDYKKKSANTVGEFEEVKAQIVNAQEQLDKAKEQENALKMGNIVDEEGKTCDARQELMRVEDEINKIQPDFQVGDQQYKEDMKKLQGMEQELKKTPSDDKVERDYNTKLQKANQLKAEALKRNINPDDSTHEIVRTSNSNKQRMDALEREKQRICNQNFHLSFQYNKNAVDSSKIHGCMYQLVKFKNIEEWGGGLEVLAGGVVGHIVVEDEHVGKALIQKGSMNRRVNLHPLSVFKTQNRSHVTQADLDRRLGPGKAVPAIDLLEYNPRYKEIVQHFFGGKVLCDTIETAKKIAFDMHHWACSKLGDVADPDGLMQGGSRKNLGLLIKTCDKLREICTEMKELDSATGDLQRRLQSAKANEEFMKTLELAKRDLQNAEETRKLTSHSLLQKEIQELKQRLQQDAEKLKDWKQQLDKYEKERKTWSTKVNQLEHLREKGKKDNAALINKWEKALDAAKKKYESKQKHFGDIDVEIKSLEALIADCQKDIEAAQKEVDDCNEYVRKMTTEFDAIQERYTDKKRHFDDAVEASQQWNAEFNQIEEEIRELGGAIHKIELAKIKRGNTREKLEGNVNHCQSELKHLQNEHKMVNFEKDQIPPEERRSLHELKAEADRLRKRFDELRERIDVDAAEQFGTTKKLLRDAEDKLRKVEENKQSLMLNMQNLDDHKLSIVLEAYNKVNDEFNKMMGTLLPDSAARLVAVNSDDLSQGLNIHVNLGGVWKESLSELSGGQKSLVALALVLSLCMFNPAPFYILDEIDSALDLNHTQNIGVLIKRRFTGTQFICVSLKDGMYSNCNILFQVQFINGRSEVKRCVRQSSKKPGESDEIALSQKNTKRFNKIISGK